MWRVVLAATALSGTLSAAQAGSTLAAVEQAAEVSLRALELPATHSGVVEFTVCSGCALRSATISGSTRYFVNGRVVTFDAFVAAVAAARTAAESVDRSLVCLYLDIATQRVMRIALVTPLPQR